jgi:S-formylglutathione hydrolase FrmB
MPDSGWVGWYTNWKGATQGGFAPNWETFHVDQLVPWIDANFNTTGRRSGRAVAGVSMGGIGALMYATRHPFTFSAVGSFSGVPDLRLPLLHQTVSDNASGFEGAGASVGFVDLANPAYWITSPPPGDVEGRFQAVFGSPGPRGDWPQRNPIRRAFTYHAFDGRMAIYSGQATPTFPSEEADFGTTNQAFHEALRANWVDHRYCSGPGHHLAPFFQNDLADFLNYVYATPWDQCTTNAGWVDDWQPAP